VAGIDHHSLTKAMEKAGMSPKQLADELGLSLQYVCDIQKGRRKLKRRPDLVKEIAEKLDVPIHWIASREVAG
jgi:transcriptional regulator with XRE-family HTH domain